MYTKSTSTTQSTRKSIITKTLITNVGDLQLFSTNYNFIGKQGISFVLKVETNLKPDVVYRRNGYQYLLLANDDGKELYILPHENIKELITRITSKLDNTQTEKEVLDLIIEQM